VKVLQGVTKDNWQDRYDFVIGVIDKNEHLVDIRSSHGMKSPNEEILLSQAYNAISALRKMKEENKW